MYLIKVWEHNMSLETIKEMHKQENISGSFITLLRVTLGFAFLTTWISNLAKGVFTSSGFKGTISYFLDHPDHWVTPFDDFTRNFIFPLAPLLAPAWLIVELFISLSLLFGAFTRLGSIIGAGSTIFLGIGTLGVEWLWTQPLLLVGFITCALTGAGRWYGLDYWLKDKVSGKISKFLI